MGYTSERDIRLSPLRVGGTQQVVVRDCRSTQDMVVSGVRGISLSSEPTLGTHANTNGIVGFRRSKMMGSDQN